MITSVHNNNLTEKAVCGTAPPTRFGMFLTTSPFIYQTFVECLSQKDGHLFDVPSNLSKIVYSQLKHHFSVESRIQTANRNNHSFRFHRTWLNAVFSFILCDTKREQTEIRFITHKVWAVSQDKSWIHWPALEFWSYDWLAATVAQLIPDVIGDTRLNGAIVRFPRVFIVHFVLLFRRFSSITRLITDEFLHEKFKSDYVSHRSSVRRRIYEPD
jgi:hypothetical protein